MIHGIARVGKAMGWRIVVLRQRVSSGGVGSVDGIIGWVSEDELALERELDCPYVCISQQGPGLGLPTVLPDNAKIGELVAREMIGRGFRHLASFLTRDPVMSNAQGRDAAFEAAAREAGCDFHRFTHGRRTAQRWALMDQLADLGEWLAAVDKPVAVLASDDEHGWRVLAAAREAGLTVPSEVAVVGVENDEAFCEFCDPPLASVDVNQPGIGEQAAGLMRRLLAGEPAPTQPILVTPVGLVWRRSCDAQVVADPQVTQMLSYIHEHLENGIRAGDVAEAFEMSARTLDRRMRAALDKPPGEVIRQARLERALRLLRTTPGPMIDIAVACGYGHLSQFSRDIKRMTGQTPTQHREAEASGTGGTRTLDLPDVNRTL